MYENRRKIRSLLRKMSRKEATAWLKSFELHEEEEKVIELCDIMGLSNVAAADRMCCSCEVISRRKTTGYDRMLRDIKDNMPE